MKNATVTNSKPVQNVPVQSKPEQNVPAEVTILTTRHLAKKFNLKPTQLRRILRSMPEYNDGLHTNYAWAGWDDPMIKKIEAKIHARAVAAADKAIATKAETNQAEAKQVA